MTDARRTMKELEEGIACEIPQIRAELQAHQEQLKKLAAKIDDHLKAIEQLFSQK